jgi:hypothetical protein
MEIRNATTVASGEVDQQQAAATQYVEPFADSGGASDVTQVKADVVADIQADTEIQRHADQGPPANLSNAVAAAWSSTVVSSQVSALEAGMNDAAADPSYVSFIDNDVVVEEWQGVRINGNDAFAVFKGYERRKFPGEGWQDDQEGQWQAHVTNESGTWKLVDQTQANIPPE